MSKRTYFDRVREFQSENTGMSWKEACEWVSAHIADEKKLAEKPDKPKKVKSDLIPCIRCGYEINDPGTAFVCAACGIQN